MKISILILISFFTSCMVNEYEKPFIIIGKKPRYSDMNTYLYYYVDKGKHEHSFQDYRNYNVGDTLK